MGTRAMAVALVVIAAAGLVGWAQETVYDPGSGVSLPRVVKQVRAQYPKDAMDSGVQGTVLMKCVVRRDGRPGDISVEQSLEPRLDEAAVAALKEWEFEPGTRNGMPVAVRVAIEMTFTLK